MNGYQRNVFYVIAAVPAVYPALTYAWMVVYLVWAVTTGADSSVPEGSLIWWCGWVAICATVLQWPFYFAWAIFSSELTARRRIEWVALIFVMNMLVMPYFLWLKYRGSMTRADKASP